MSEEYNTIVKTTAKAWLLDIQDQQVWVPKSQCTIDSQSQIIKMPEWLAEDKNLSTEKLPPVDHKNKPLESDGEFPF